MLACTPHLQALVAPEPHVDSRAFGGLLRHMKRFEPDKQHWLLVEEIFTLHLHFFHQTVLAHTQTLSSEAEQGHPAHLNVRDLKRNARSHQCNQVMDAVVHSVLCMYATLWRESETDTDSPSSRPAADVARDAAATHWVHPALAEAHPDALLRELTWNGLRTYLDRRTDAREACRVVLQRLCRPLSDVAFRLVELVSPAFDPPLDMSSATHTVGEELFQMAWRCGLRAETSAAGVARHPHADRAPGARWATWRNARISSVTGGCASSTRPEPRRLLLHRPQFPRPPRHPTAFLRAPSSREFLLLFIGPEPRDQIAEEAANRPQAGGAWLQWIPAGAWNQALHSEVSVLSFHDGALRPEPLDAALQHRVRMLRRARGRPSPQWARTRKLLLDVARGLRTGPSVACVPFARCGRPEGKLTQLSTVVGENSYRLAERASALANM